jgi:glycosyltransferase involved in cell wall biosynthesis
MKAHRRRTYRRVSTGVVVSANYREGAIMAIAREANAQGLLAKLYCSVEVSRLNGWAGRLPHSRVTARVSKRLNQMSIHGVDPYRITCVSRAAELVHLLGRRLPGGNRIAQRLMYWAKRRFDRRVAHALARLAPSAIVAVYGAAEHTFAQAGDADTLKVLHVVNSHPDEQNELLMRLAGLGRNHRELLPARAVRQVCHEIELADVLLVPSKFVADQLMTRGVPASKIATVPYGVDFDRFHPPQEKRHDKRPLTCLFVGHISHRKGVRFLLEAARQFGQNDVQFLLVGPLVSPELVDDLPRNVRWMPTLSHGDVASQMRQSDIFVLPSIEDSYGLVVLEAMASGLPVIVSDHAGASERIQDQQNGLVVPAADSAALRRAVALLASDEGLRLRLGTAARAALQVDLSWSVYGARVLREINERLPL